jgi:GDP-L-fucose synthase
MRMVDMNRNSRIYVAGHRGLVGSAIMRKLLDEGCQNLVVRTRMELDLTDQGAVNRFFEDEKPEYIFLAAARVGGILANDTHPAEFIRDNLLVQANVIDSAHKSGATKLLFLGSACIYPKMAPQPLKEEYLLSGPLEPTNEWYAVAKIAGIKMCQAYRRQYGFNAISVMPINLYGPGDNYNLQTSHVLPALIRKFHLAKLAMKKDFEAIAEDESKYGSIPDDFKSTLNVIARSSTCPADTLLPDCAVPLWGTGAPRREFLYVDDLADACVFLMRRYDSGEIINIGVGKDLTIGELARLVAETVGFEGSISFDSSKPDGTPQKLLDVSKMSSLGWRCQVDLRRGIRMTYDWYRKTVVEVGAIKPA